MKKLESNTEELIFASAIKIFHKKGLAGARMQEIADEAGINKAMLHYYFRSKQLLFEAVFKKAFMQLAPQIHQVLNSEDSLFEKIINFTDKYISFVMENRFLPTFIIQELNNNPDFANQFFSQAEFPKSTRFLIQIEEGIQNGTIKNVNPKQLLIDMFSLAIFPFIGAPLLQKITNVNESAYNNLLIERKKHIASMLINSIKK
ncbi:MAG TPA: TetR/AcrR family transcriptional regulator [Flavobacterium sp.]|jgi:AcrR family transcriptional regulator|uniref:TetR/AcrR family transcriptional regulator n=1 Tax=Flavobacterium sp. TaxID=239 RepID=UPI002BCDDC97|nr:TetR/AcrR family transcriptional regulator [Flavobacterium sp.]HPW97335.1 TetR/AcrR family transcriptional regulator [Flavobacterium sp.]HQA73134.1 TetR/AcrR family transcriptional regulator [Flavobacterium sp.]